uniref:peptidylprolyl isomerase n=1 Tax=uncultured organism TaxID=155900 RepID=M1P0R6_9ZZZZ|nr:trigger factor [uncultured organism]AGF93312.1 trigger factor [uncultured organism]
MQGFQDITIIGLVSTNYSILEVKGLKSTVKERTDSEVRLEVTIESSTVNEKLDEIYNKTVQELDVPGFRKGKVPRSFVKARFGDDVFYEDAQNELVEEYLPEALKENGIDPVSQPETEIVDFERDEDFTFEASVEVMPELELGDYTDVEIEDPGTEEVSEEEIEEKLEEMREENGQLVPKEGEVVEDGDYVLVSDPDGNTQQVNVSEDDPTSDLIGKSVGDQVIIGPNEEEGARLEVEEIKELQLPELDDELAKDLGHDDLQSLRTDIKSNLFEEKEEEREEELKDRVLEDLLESTEFSPPERMIQNMVDERVSETKEQLGSEKYSEILEEQGKTEDEVAQDIEESARKQLKRRMVLNEIARQEEIEMTDEEFENRLEEEAEQQDVNPIKFKNQLKAEDQLESYRESLNQEKVLDFLLEQANLTSEEGKDE